ncbi:MAG: sulfate ABC transporter substrate-binding protein [Leptospirales bacterium]|nr:sulfate ABC transporter substrate-binding protein [Leptospirales bacterium]
MTCQVRGAEPEPTITTELDVYSPIRGGGWRRRLWPLFGLALAAACSQGGPERRLLHVSFDSTSELFAQLNPVFLEQWQVYSGQRWQMDQSHGGSARQAQAVLEGLDADVVSLALAYDVDQLADPGGLLSVDWQQDLPEHSCPFFSTIVFVVRKGNPWRIRDWNDLLQPGLKLVMPNPRSSGGARWAYLAAWATARRRGGGETEARRFLKALLAHAQSLAPSARAAASDFVQRGRGDVLLAWENEAQLILERLGPEGFEIITPPISILAEPAVAVVAANVRRHGAVQIARAYLHYLYQPQAQAQIAQFHFRPRDHAAFALGNFSKLQLLDIRQEFGGWRQAQRRHFADGAEFDQIFEEVFRP